MSRELYIGLMSGTSMDGLDCALVYFDSNTPQLLDFISPALNDSLKERLLSLCKGSQTTLIEVGELDHLIAHDFAETITELLKRNSLTAADISAIGSHGQTVWHQPARKGKSGIPFTMQLGDPNLISQKTGITTVADFRRRDMAAGGQAAPLVPAFHSALYRLTNIDCIVVNIGGIANITRLPADQQQPVIAYDTGPGNVLMDAWIMRHQQRNYDADGQWAATGTPHTELLNQLLKEPYLGLTAPKSTGRELFNSDWLDRQLMAFGKQIPENDIQATLLEFTAQSIGQEVQKQFSTGKLVVCGGGASNDQLLKRLDQHLPGFTVGTSTDEGMDPDAMEAAAFAWMARQTMHRKPIDLCSITGASEPVILGGVYYND